MCNSDDARAEDCCGANAKAAEDGRCAGGEVTADEDEDEDEDEDDDDVDASVAELPRREDVTDCGKAEGRSDWRSSRCVGFRSTI